MVIAPDRLDAHQHFWRVDRQDYPWMPATGPLRRDYLPDDYFPLAAAAGIGGSILVQAAPTVAETEYLLSIAENRPEVLGVVGWFDLEARSASDLTRLASHPKLVGVRPMIQNLGDDRWITRPAVTKNLERIAALDLTFDLLCYPRHLVHAASALSNVPELRVVIDHLAKPDYSHLEPMWLQGMSELATLPNMHCKIAGLVTEIGANWQNADFSRHVAVVFELFGARRLMIGTDWPVLNTAASFGDVIAHYDDLVAGRTDEERAELWAGTAARFYGVAPGVAE